MPSDDRSTPPLVADHYAPLAVDFTLPADDLVSDAAGGGGPCETVADGSSPLGSPDARPENAPNTLDFYGYWKLADGLLDAAFRDTHREYALGNTPEQRSLGYLSDGTPVTPLTLEPPAPP